MKKQLTLSLLTLLLVGCGTNSESKPTEEEKPSENKVTEAEKTFEVTDLMGRKNTIKTSDKERVLCIGAGALRLYSYIGDINKIIAVEDIDRDVNANMFADVSRPYYDINKEYFKTLPSCGKGGPKAQQAEAEKILECRPTMIISEYEDVLKANTLQEQIGVPVIILKYGRKSVFDDNINKSLTLLGKVLGKEEKAKTLNDYIDNCENELSAKAATAQRDKKSIYIGGLGNWGTQDIYSTSSSFPLFEVSNIKNAVSSSIKLQNGQLEKEAFLSLNPDKIVLDSAGLKKFKTTYQTNAEDFNTMDAFKNNEIYLEMPFNAYYTNLEIALMDAYFLASVAYPEVYKDMDMNSKYDEIGTAFLGSACYSSSVKTAKMSYCGFQKISNIKDFLTNV